MRWEGRGHDWLPCATTLSLAPDLENLGPHCYDLSLWCHSWTAWPLPGSASHHYIGADCSAFAIGVAFVLDLTSWKTVGLGWGSCQRLRTARKGPELMRKGRRLGRGSEAGLCFLSWKGHLSSIQLSCPFTAVPRDSDGCCHCSLAPFLSHLNSHYPSEYMLL